MLSDYEAAVLTRLKVTGGGRRVQRMTRRDKRIGAALAVLSLLSALGLLHTTVSGWGEYARAKQGATDERVQPAAADADVGTNVVDPPINGDASAPWFGYLEFESRRP
ncbi:MAG: hypothetical protein K2Y71_04725 [Xanthobacteraceae bacterium]|nr:hypothetical protein [Xanthobacteraceae bacterium]